MPNSLFRELNGGTPVPQMNQNPMAMFQQFRQNPLQFLLSRRINIPQQYMNDPKSAVEYLIRNGQMSQDQFNRLVQMANQMGVNIN